MTETITKDKTLLVLAFAVTFLAGATVIGFISDYDAEAAPKKPKPPIEPILKPINATVAQLEKYHEQLVVIKFSMTGTADLIEDGIDASFFNDGEKLALVFALEKIELEAEDIRDLAFDTIETITG